jgi:hypothetical protein
VELVVTGLDLGVEVVVGVGVFQLQQAVLVVPDQMDMW